MRTVAASREPVAQAGRFRGDRAPQVPSPGFGPGAFEFLPVEQLGSRFYVFAAGEPMGEERRHKFLN